MSKDQIAEAFAKYEELEQKIKELKEQIKPLEKEQAVCEALLMKGIKQGETKSGVHHTVFERKTPKYKEILLQVRERYTPKTKQGEIDILVDELTSVTYTHKFELEA